MSAIVRKAIVEVGSNHEPEDRLRVVQAYLPANYIARLESNAAPYDESIHIVIEGVDSAGWTLDDYVIPRLASGLITATEVTLSWPIRWREL